MKKVLRVSTFPTVEKPGMGLHPSKLCGMHNVFTYYLTPYESCERLFSPENTLLIQKYFLLSPRPKNVNVFSKFWFFFKRISSVFFFSLSGIYILLFKKVEIVHIHSPMYILIAFFAFLVRKKVFITFHGTDFHRIKNAYWYRVFSKVFNKVFIISPDMLEELSLIHGKDKIINVYNGIDLNVFSNKNTERKKRFIAVGSLKEEKGFKYLIDAFTMAVSQCENLSDYELIIVGEGLLEQELLDLIKTNDMLKRITLVGHKNRDELLALYNESEVFILSSISEGFPKVILEAIACGCEVITTDVGAINSIFNETETCIVPPANAKVLAESISKIHKSKKIDYSCVLKKYTWDSVQLEYLDTYK